ncbi:SagB family peptide dehydrogenase [Geodermatophilus maliterrae]|uniref:SagB family peptide dehydrogenase n=1 Tax=Geodermatophilus maliterrae TaxID=3162531 RepID=A0ABV3XAD3_9ACTN
MDQVLGEDPDPTSMTRRLWSLSDDALVEADVGSLTVVSRWGERTIDGVDPAGVELLRRMGFGPVSLQNSLPSRGEPAGRLPVGDEATVRSLEEVLDQLRGVVVHSLATLDGQGPLLSVAPVVRDPEFRPTPVGGHRTVRLSCFATIRPQGDHLLLEVPGAPYQALLGQPAAAAVATALAAPATIADVVDRTGVPPPVVADVLSFLVAAGVLLLADEDGRFEEDHDTARRGWAHHELLFHALSRSRQGGRPPDAVVRLQTTDPAPVTLPRPAGRRFVLPHPDPAALAAGDPTLTDLLESDHECPHVSGESFTAGQLGELLFRSARVRSTGPALQPVLAQAAGHVTSQRPYLSTACLYELELYLTVDRCTDLPRGSYHYDPLEHCLTLVDEDDARTDAALDVARAGAGVLSRPAAMLTITARLGRLSAVLAGAAYATALKHCGMLQGTLYQAARAMGVSAHPIPAEAGALIGRLSRLPWPAEVGVGECVLDPRGRPGSRGRSS